MLRQSVAQPVHSDRAVTISRGLPNVTARHEGENRARGHRTRGLAAQIPATTQGADLGRDVPRLPRRRRAHPLPPKDPRARRPARPRRRSSTPTATYGARHSRQRSGSAAWTGATSIPHAAFELGVQALELTFAQLVPQARRAGRVQRKLEFTLAPGLEWTVALLPRPRDPRRTLTGEPRRGRRLQGQGQPDRPADKADRDPQACLYLAGRWLEGGPSREFCFAQIAKPGPRRKEMSARSSPPADAGQLRGALARIALAARRSSPTTGASGPIGRGGSPTRPAGSAPRFCSAWAHARRRRPVTGGGLPRARYLLHRTHRAEQEPAMPDPFAERYRAAMRERAAARSRPASSDGWPTTNALTAAYPATAPQSAGAGRRRTHPSSPSPGGPDRRKPAGRPPDHRWAARPFTAARSGTAPPRSRADGSCARPHWQLVPEQLKRALRQAWRARAGAGTRDAPAAAAQACLRAAPREQPARPRSEPAGRWSAGSWPATGTPTTPAGESWDEEDITRLVQVMRCRPHKPHPRTRRCVRCGAFFFFFFFFFFNLATFGFATMKSNRPPPYIHFNPSAMSCKA